jgi:hypothetical protein
MFWSRILNILFVIVTILIFNGCAREVAIGVVGSLGQSYIATPSELDYHQNKRLYSENIPNDEFLDALLDTDYIEGLKREDVLWVDNANPLGGNASYLTTKIVITKQYIYFVEMTPNNGFFDCKKSAWYCDWSTENYKYFLSRARHGFSLLPILYFDVDLKEVASTKIDKIYAIAGFESYEFENEKPEILHIIAVPRWYKRNNLEYQIISRYNDIYKMKEIIDERIEFYKQKSIKDKEIKNNVQDNNIDNNSSD